MLTVQFSNKLLLKIYNGNIYIWQIFKFRDKLANFWVNKSVLTIKDAPVANSKPTVAFLFKKNLNKYTNTDC